MKLDLINILLILNTFLCVNFVDAKRRKVKRLSPKTYVKKESFAGLGKASKANGRIKLTFRSGHFKRTRKGFVYVNPYSTSV